MDAVDKALTAHKEATSNRRPNSGGGRPNSAGGPPPMARRASFATRTIPTFKFSAALEQASAKQEEAMTLEEWRLYMKKFFNHSKFGKYYENALILLSLISCFEYIYKTYLDRSDPYEGAQIDSLEILELIFAGIFGFDWCLNIFLAEHRILYFMSVYSIIDLMTVIPICVTYGYRLPDVNYIHTVPTALLYTVFAMNTTQILRALRIRRKLARIQDAVERFMGELLLAVIVMILFFASVMQFLEYTYQPNDYHTWMYYIWVTISTVGYGDITPRSTQGRVAVMCIIGFSIISIPKMTNELIEKMALQSVYMRNSYTPKTRDSKHVIICGDISSTSLNAFYEELFHEDHENVDLNAIMLLPCPPTTEIIFLLRDSTFFLNLMYLEGSALVDKDLKRAKAQSAVAIFIMTNKFSNRPDEEDAKSILLNLSIKRFVASFNLPPKLFCLQLIRPQNRRHLAREEGDEMSALDLVVCLNEIKMGVLAKAVMYPGANTLLMNLISSFSDEPVEVDEDDTAAVNLSTDSGKTMQNVSAKAWLAEYQKGCDWEIYTTPLAKVFEGAKFAELSYALYEKVGVVLFALQITDAKVEGSSKLLLNPANFIIPSQDLFMIEAFVIAQNKASSDLSFSTAKVDAAQQAIRNIEAGFQQLQRVNRNISTLGGLRKTQHMDSSKLEALRKRMQVGATPEEAPPGDQEVAPEVQRTASSRWKSLKRKNLVAKKVESFSYQEILHQLEDQHMKREYYLRTTPVEFAACVVKTNVIDEIPFINNHVIIIGKGLSNLLDLVRPLRAKFLGLLRYIVIISPEDIPHDVWTKIAIFDAILVVRGSALEEATLRRAGIFRAAQVVVLADGSDEERNAAGGGLEALVDSDAIFSYQLVKRMNPDTQIVVEIVNTSNISYLETDSNSTVDDYKFSPQFAAGNLFTTSLLDSIVCQAYYNPSIIKVLNKLISGVDNVEAAELAAEATARVASQSGDGAIVSSTATPSASKKAAPESDDSEDSDDSDTFDINGRTPPKKTVAARPSQAHGRPSQIGMNFAKVESTKRIKDIQGSCLYQMSIPDSFNERTYGKLFQRLSTQGIVPLGILRGTFAGMSVGPKANRAPYVYTNPDKDVELFKCDKIFVLSPKPLQIDNKLDLKDWLLNMQQSRALQAADAANSAKRPGSAAMTLESLDASQKKLDARITKLSKDMGHKLDGMMKMMSKIAESQNIRRNTETEDEIDGFYTLDGNGEARRFSADSVNSKNSHDKEEAEKLSARGRADTASSTRVAYRSSFRPSIDSAGSNSSSGRFDDGAGMQPAKSKSLSRIMQSPNGIMRKKSNDGSESSKKRHSFSDPIATVKVIGLSPKRVSARRGFGAFAEGVSAENERLQQESIQLSDDEEDEEDGEDDTEFIADSPTPSPETVPTRKVPSLARMLIPQMSPRSRVSPRGEESNAPTYASPRIVPLNLPTTLTSKSAELLSSSHLQEETKMPSGEDDNLTAQASSRSIQSDSSTLRGTPPKYTGEDSPGNELNQRQREVTRQKPTPPTKETALHSAFAPATSKKSAFSMGTIAGPPLELALDAMQQKEKQRAASTGRAPRQVL